MAIKTMHTSELVQLAAAGGGFKINISSRPLGEIIQIAAAARGKARLTITGIASRPVAELVQIAAAGSGSVEFED